MVLDYMQRRTWAEIDMDALRHNYSVLRDITPSSSKMCCIIKADAYGHGAVPIAKLYESLGADFLAVSNIEEAMTVRRSGVKLPMLILGYTHPSCAEILTQNDISQCVYSYEYGKSLEEQAKLKNVKIKIHLKIDVGMGRIGFILREEDDSSFNEALELCESPYFITEGIFTHFPMADEGDKGRKITQTQFKNFYSSIKRFEDKNVNFAIRHCNNSAATVKFPEYSLDMVRVGVSLYGISNHNIELKNTLSLKTVVSNIKMLKKGDTIGYGCEYIVDKDMLVATLPIGYADGFKRENLQNSTKIYIKGNPCPITGRICMDQTMIDITNIKNVNIGEEAVIYGSGSPVTLSDFSDNNKKIPYETMCEISARVPRVYRDGEEILFIRNSLV